ncbi:MAG: hypothetical protein AB1546_03370 [bacterium]
MRWHDTALLYGDMLHYGSRFNPEPTGANAMRPCGIRTQKNPVGYPAGFVWLMKC